MADERPVMLITGAGRGIGAAVARAAAAKRYHVVLNYSTSSDPADELAAEIRGRTGAIAEGMEGAACGLVAARTGVRFAELRVISNRTGRRDQQGWNLDGAFKRLGEILGPMRAMR